MKLLAALFAFALPSSLAAHTPPVSVSLPPPPKPGDPLDLDRMLRAIEQAENTPQWKVGPDGERSTFQITAAVWRMYSHWPHESASSNRVVCRAEAQRVARCHVEHLRRELASWELPESPRIIGLAWTAGLWATVNGTASLKKRAHADRVANLYYDLP